MNFAWKTAVIVVSVIGVSILGVIWINASHPSVRQLTFKSVDYTGWKTYHDEKMGITIKYPPGYKIKDRLDVLDKVDGASGRVYVVPEHSTNEPEFGILSVLMYEYIDGVPHMDLAAFYKQYLAQYKANPHLYARQPEIVSLNNHMALYVSWVHDGMLPVDVLQNYTFIRDSDSIEVSIATQSSEYIDGILHSLRFDK